MIMLNTQITLFSSQKVCLIIFESRATSVAKSRIAQSPDEFLQRQDLRGDASGWAGLEGWASPWRATIRVAKAATATPTTKTTKQLLLVQRNWRTASISQLKSASKSLGEQLLDLLRRLSCSTISGSMRGLPCQTYSASHTTSLSLTCLLVLKKALFHSPGASGPL